MNAVRSQWNPRWRQPELQESSDAAAALERLWPVVSHPSPSRTWIWMPIVAYERLNLCVCSSRPAEGDTRTNLVVKEPAWKVARRRKKKLLRVSSGDNRGGTLSRVDRRSFYILPPKIPHGPHKPSVSINCPRENHIRFVIFPVCFSANGHGNRPWRLRVRVPVRPDRFASKLLIECKMRLYRRGGV